MHLTVLGSQRSFSTELHWAILDESDYLLAASFAGVGVSVRAVAASIIEARYLEIINFKDRRRVYAYKGEYRKLERQTGATNHGIVLHKAAVLAEERPNSVVIARDGNLGRAVGEFMSARYNLPAIWQEQYLGMVPLVLYEELEVIVNPLSPQFQQLQALQFSVKLTEEFILNEVDRRLRQGKLLIPQLPASLKAQFDPKWDMREYLRQNAAVLARQLDTVRPRHDPATDQLDPAIAAMQRIPFPAQAHMIQGLVNALQEQNSVFCCGDMGTGKSIIALGVAHLLHKQKGKGMRVLLAAPGITVPKWAGLEIPQSLSEAAVRVLSGTEDALRLLKEIRSGQRPDGLEFIIVGTDRAKLGPDPWCAALWKRVKGAKFKAWHCPECGEPLLHPDYKQGEEGDEAEETLAEWDVLAEGLAPEEAGGYFELVDIPKNGQEEVLHKRTPNGFPRGFEVKWKTRSKLKKCQRCDSKLWRPALKSRGETKNKPRWYISRILKKLHGHFDLMVQDEVHQVKAQDSGRGDAFAQMVRAAPKTLALTGTLVNGKSTSIKEILWRTDARDLLAEGFNHRTGMVAWADRYGVLERVTQVEEEDVGVVTRQKRTQLQPTEKPGIAPELTARYLLHKAGFMELGDLGLPLVELKELPVFIEMHKDHAREYRMFHDELHQVCRQRAAHGDKGAWAKFTPATINYADRPDLGAKVVLAAASDNPTLIVAPEFPPDYYNAKERWLVEMLQKELAENRGVMVYANYTASYGVQYRIQHVLKVHGIEAQVLGSNVSPEKRVEWLQTQQEKGSQVLICNMRLVETGLDLLPWPTIVFYQLNYDINTVRQAGRRAWRIGQHRECRVFYPVMDGTQQVAQFENIMQKRGHAMLVEGRLDRSELAQFSRDAHSALAADIADCLAQSDLAQKWQALAARDMDTNLTTVSEAKFKEAVREAQEKLVLETLRLCGREGKARLLEPASEFGLAGVEIQLRLDPIGKPGKETEVFQLAFF